MHAALLDVQPHCSRPPPCAPQDWLTSTELKYYESKVNLNWKNILKSIKEVRGGTLVPGPACITLPDFPHCRQTSTQPHLPLLPPLTHPRLPCLHPGLPLPVVQQAAHDV